MTTPTYPPQLTGDQVTLLGLGVRAVVAAPVLAWASLTNGYTFVTITPAGATDSRTINAALAASTDRPTFCAALAAELNTAGTTAYTWSVNTSSPVDGIVGTAKNYGSAWNQAPTGTALVGGSGGVATIGKDPTSTNPKQIPITYRVPGLKLAISADSGVTAVAGVVTSVLDGSGNGFHATAQGSPTIDLTALNGKPAFQFPLGTDRLKNVADTLWYPNQARTVFAVIKPAPGFVDGNFSPTQVVGGPIFATPASAANDASHTFGVDLFSANSPSRLFLYDDGGYTWPPKITNAVAAPNINGVPLVYCLRYGGLVGMGIGKVSINGHQIASSSSVSEANNQIKSETQKAGYVVGGRTDSLAGYKFGGSIACVYAYEGALSDEDEESVTKFLMDKYSIAEIPDLLIPAKAVDLRSGFLSFTITASDATTLSFTITAEHIKQVAQEMGQGGGMFCYLDFTNYGPRISLSKLWGKTISSVTTSVLTRFSGGNLISSSSDIRWFLTSTTGGEAGKGGSGIFLEYGNGGTEATSPANYVVDTETRFRLNLSLVSSVT